MSNNTHDDYTELEQPPVAPPHKSHRWLAVGVIFFLWVLFAGGMLITSHKIYIYTPHASLIKDLVTPTGDTKINALHFCGPMLVIKEEDRFCMAALWPADCIFKFDASVPDGIPIGINSVKPAVAVGMRDGIGYEINIFRKCLHAELFKEKRWCNRADDVNCTMPGDK